MGTGGLFPGGKSRPGRDAEHSLQSSAEVKSEELYALSPLEPEWSSGTALLAFNVNPYYASGRGG
jgi:hypothetical protein